MRTREALALSQGLHDRVGKVYGLALLAWLAAEQGLALQTGMLWGAIEAAELRGRIGPWEIEREDYASHVLAMAWSEFDFGRTQGQTMSLDEAVEYGLSDARSAGGAGGS